jgi:trimeric autotransporter adhesin
MIYWFRAELEQSNKLENFPAITMKQNPTSQSGIFNPRVLVAFTLCFAGVLLTLLPSNARVSVADFSPPDNTFVTNGNVQAVVRSGDTIYIGGLFNRVGPRTGPGVELALDGSQIAGLPEVTGAGGTVTGGGGAVQAVASDGSGGWYIGGLFTHVGGVARNNIAHIRADHSVDPAFDPNANDGIHALAVSGSTVYAAGLFTSIGGQTRNRIAGLNAADGTATAFNPNADAGIEALAISGSGLIIYAGGRFAMIGGQPRDAIAALNAADGSATTTFNPMPNNRLVLALAISGSTLYVGGYFTAIGGQPRNNIAALNASDGMATSFDPNATTNGCNACGGVSAIVVSSSTVYAGGLFTHIGGQNRRYCAALNAANGTATPFNPDPNGNILGLAVSVDGLTV